VNERPLTYAGAGVDLAVGDAAMERIRRAARRTWNRDVVELPSGFAGAYTPDAADPVLAAGCDGVGTKIALGRAAGRLRGLGVDLVAMCVNDVLTAGGRPAFFLDYIACGHLDGDTVAELVEGMADGCAEAGCVLLGGETAEHPGLMEPDEFDLAGFCVAVGERRDLIGGARIAAGDAIVGLPSSGVHSNGFSLVRRLLERAGIALDERPDALGGQSVADALLEPTRIYARAARALVATVDVRGMAHVTGGGIPGNLPRPLRAGLEPRVDWESWERPAVFGWLASLGVEEEEMRRVFNLGLGYAAYVPAGQVETALAAARRGGVEGWVAGEVVATAADAR
jgi:phosphoribosylformylglycinamidine cyclo-ligase